MINSRILSPSIVVPLSCCLGGCGVSAFVQSVAPPVSIVGQGANSIQIVVTKDDAGKPVWLGGHADVFELDLTSLAKSQLWADVDASTATRPDFMGIPRAVTANDHWIAWIDPPTRNVHSIDRNSSIEQVVATGVAVDHEFTLDAIYGDRLVAKEFAGGTAFDVEFLEVDLRSGNQMRIGDSEVYNNYAISGDTFALFNNQPTTIEPIGLELVTNLDLVDLLTGERTTAARDFRIYGDGATIVPTQTGFIWQEFKTDIVRTRLVQFDLGANKRTVLANPLERSGQSTTLVAGDDSRILLLTGKRDNAFGIERLESRKLQGGDSVTVTAVSPLGYSDPHLVNGYAVWVEIGSNLIVVFDLNARTVRTVNPLQDYPQVVTND